MTDPTADQPVAGAGEPGRECPWCATPAAPEATHCGSCGAALAQRESIGDLQIPVYLYEAAQPNKQRNNLSVIRAGEYEGFFKKIKLYLAIGQH